MIYNINILKKNICLASVFSIILFFANNANAQINFICPEADCANGIDDDGDGYIDCFDLDCVLNEQRPAKPDEQKILNCYNLSEECVNHIAAFQADEENDIWLQQHLVEFAWALSFMAEHDCTEEAGRYAMDALILKMADSEINLDRVNEFYSKLIEGPYALVEGCPDIDLQTYSDLLNLQVPSSINDLLESYEDSDDCEPIFTQCPPPIEPCYSIETFEQGTSTLANIDYYAVEITQIPDFDANGIPDTKEEIYQKFRERFTMLVSGMTTITHTNCPSPVDVIHASWAFAPYDTDIDLPLWQSRQIGARFFIDADAEEGLASLVADDGAIITIQENEFNFIVATIRTPRSGDQPFAGKRMWGIRTNENGNCEIFTRAIDRALPLGIISMIASASEHFGCDELDYFEIADRTWLNMQSQISEFLTEGNGVGFIKYEPPFHVQFGVLLEMLKSDVPVNFVSCP